MQTRVTKLLNIEWPIIQAGMIWCSGWELASAVSNAGCLGVIGSGSMYPDELIDNIKKCQQHTNKPFAVNIPLLYPAVEEHIQNIIDLKVPIVITSAGNPAKYTQRFKEAGIVVMHVVSNLKFALKCQACGVDAIVAEGFEAGGHNGIEETTTMCLIPLLKQKCTIPIIAAGGIGSGMAMAAAFCLGAEAVQIGSLFVASIESSANQAFKQMVVEANEGDTKLTLKELTPVRLLKNKFYNEIEEAYTKGANKEQLAQLLGRGRAKKGMFLGDLVDGELEIGQVSANIDFIKPAKEIVNNLKIEFMETIKNVSLNRN